MGYSRSTRYAASFSPSYSHTHTSQDYSARAKDFNFKKAKLKALRQKATNKNPDEFYFGMLSRKGPVSTGKNTTGTVNSDRGNTQLDQETVRLLKTQDLGYIRTMRNKAMKEVKAAERLVTGIKWKGRATVFVDAEEEQVDKSEHVGRVSRFVVSEEDRGYEYDDLEGMDDKLWDAGPMGANVAVNEEAILQQKAQERRATRLLARLEAAKARLKVLTDVEDALDLQRAKLAKSVTVGGINKYGVRFKIRERKR
jgi:U3 small nucleolar RNA-associated protein 11